MLLTEERLRKIILEEIESLEDIEGDVIRVSSDGNCFFTSRARDVPGGRLRRDRTGRGLAMDIGMQSIMKHPNLKGLKIADLDWDLLDEEWADGDVAVTVLTRGCRKTPVSGEEVLDTGDYRPDIRYPVPDRPAEDTGEFSSDEAPAVTEVNPGDGQRLIVKGVGIGINRSGQVVFGDKSYQTRVATVNSRGEPGRSVAVTLLSMKRDNEDSISVKGSIPRYAASAAGLETNIVESILPIEEINPHIERLGDGDIPGDVVVIGPLETEPEPTFVMFRKQF